MTLIALLVAVGGVGAATRGGVDVSGGEDGLRGVLVAAQTKYGSSPGLDTAR